MFDYINGRVVHKTPTAIVIESNGIGYKIHIPLSTFERIPDKEKIKILTRLIISKDFEVKVYGFSSPEERDLFDLLISISGVGPNMALTILSASSVSQFKKSVVRNDSQALQRIKGVGKKTAERIILELKENIVSIVPEEISSVEAQELTTKSDAIMALISLGYARPSAERAVNLASKNLDASEKVEVLIKEALKYT
ncbi:MAG: Holliday junction branch migration protein RuvA [Candidatus Scalinduaceae bacterium]